MRAATLPHLHSQFPNKSIVDSIASNYWEVSFVFSRNVAENANLTKIRNLDIYDTLKNTQWFFLKHDTVGWKQQFYEPNILNNRW
jgi:hypothetical protein